MRSDSSNRDPIIEVFQETLERPIAFHPVFVDLTRSVTAALLLSQAVYWTKRVPSGNWFYRTMKQWEEETKLSRHEQENARKILRQFSFWHEERRGVPAQMYFRVDMTGLYNELFFLKERKDVRLPESGKLDCRKAANKSAGKQHTCMPETGKHYKGISKTTTEITSKTTTTTPLFRFQSSQGEPVSRDFVQRLLSGTILKEAKPGRIAQVAKTHKRSREEVEAVVQMLDQQYRRSTRMIKDATGLLITALRDIEPPEASAPGSEQKAPHPAENAYQEAEDKLASLSRGRAGACLYPGQSTAPSRFA